MDLIKNGNQSKFKNDKIRQERENEFKKTLKYLILLASSLITVIFFDGIPALMFLWEYGSFKLNESETVRDWEADGLYLEHFSALTSVLGKKAALLLFLTLYKISHMLTLSKKTVFLSKYKVLENRDLGYCIGICILIFKTQKSIMSLINSILSLDILILLFITLGMVSFSIVSTIRESIRKGEFSSIFRINSPVKDSIPETSNTDTLEIEVKGLSNSEVEDKQIDNSNRHARDKKKTTKRSLLLIYIYFHYIIEISSIFGSFFKEINNQNIIRLNQAFDAQTNLKISSMLHKYKIDPNDTGLVQEYDKKYILIKSGDRSKILIKNELIARDKRDELLANIAYEIGHAEQNTIEISAVPLIFKLIQGTMECTLIGFLEFQMNMFELASFINIYSSGIDTFSKGILNILISRKVLIADSYILKEKYADDAIRLFLRESKKDPAKYEFSDFMCLFNDFPPYKKRIDKLRKED